MLSIMIPQVHCAKRSYWRLGRGTICCTIRPANWRAVGGDSKCPLVRVHVARLCQLNHICSPLAWKAGGYLPPSTTRHNDWSELHPRTIRQQQLHMTSRISCPRGRPITPYQRRASISCHIRISSFGTTVCKIPRWQSPCMWLAFSAPLFRGLLRVFSTSGIACRISQGPSGLPSQSIGW